MADSELIGWLTLRNVPRLGDTAIRGLVEAFGSAWGVIDASDEDLLRAGLSESAVKAIKDPSLHRSAEDELEAAGRMGIAVLTIKDSRYPKSLASITDAPAVLYVKGEMMPGDQHAIAIVGSRKASPYGIKIAERLAGELTFYGFTVVSGLARGVDSAAHAGALASGGRTIAVLGSGLDVVYPPENRDLAHRIARQGAVISEFPLHAPPLPAHFPHRNRIISGLCLGVLVVEATERSGSLITAQCALEQGREVFAVPGNLGAANSQGTNRLIKSGAKLVEGIQDILDELSPQIECAGRRQIIGQDRPPDLEPAEAALYDLLSDEPCHIDELIKQSLMTSAQVSGVLLQLELKGCVLHLSGQRYVRAVSLEKTLK